MGKDFYSEFQGQQKIIKPKIILWFKRLYVIAFNTYAWVWLYRLIFIKHSSAFEDYLLWFFSTAGMYFFVLDSQNLFFKKEAQNKSVGLRSKERTATDSSFD